MAKKKKTKRKPKPDVAENALRVVEDATGDTLGRKVKKT